MASDSDSPGLSLLPAFGVSPAWQRACMGVCVRAFVRARVRACERVQCGIEYICVHACVYARPDNISVYGILITTHVK